MAGILLVVLMLGFGWALMRRLPLALEAPAIAAGSAAAGILSGTWAVLLCVLEVGYRIGVPLGMAVVAAGIALLWRRPRLTGAPFDCSPPWIVVTAITAWLFIALHWTHDLLPKADGLYSAGDTWGDIALHLTLASNFAAQSRFSWAFPIYHGAKLTYPFLLDFTSGLLYRLGWNWHWSMLVPSVLLDLAIAQLVFSLAAGLAKRASAGLIAVALFLCGGSAAGWQFALRDWRSTDLSLAQFLGNLPQDYSHINDLNLQFTNIVTSELLPQRGFALGIATVLLVAYALFTSDGRASRTTVLVGGVLVGLLPFVHVQSWAVGLALLVGYLAVQRRWNLFPWLLPGILFAAPQLVWQTAHTNTGSFIHVYVGWMRVAGEPLGNFWWLNFGLLLPLMLVVAWKVITSGDRFKWLLGAGALALFAMTNLLILQPNSYDNIKWILYWYLILAILASELFAKYLWALPVLGVLCLSGLLTIDYDMHRSDLLIPSGQVAYASQVQTAVPEGATILTAQQHNHPVTMLSGRPVVLGYEGWLWTYGINYAQTASDVAAMYAGGPAALTLLHKYGVQYVEIGPEEYEQYTVNAAYFQRFPIVLRSEDGVLYKIN